MGYTHYWTYQRNGSQEDWSKALSYVHRIIEESDVPLEVEYGDSQLTIDGANCPAHQDGLDHWDDCNACQDNHHETFILYTVLGALPENPAYNKDGPTTYWDFCKTAGKPYDTPVTAVLALLSTLAPNCIEVTSDGEEGYWLPGVALAERATGLSIHVPPAVAVKWGNS